MYEIRETAAGATTDVVRLVTDDITEVVNHFASEGFNFVTDVLGVKLFDHPDGRSSLVRVI